MAEDWDGKLKSFLKKTGNDLKRAGAEIQGEAQKLLAQAKDPETQQRVRARLKDVGVWAKKTGEDLADMMDHGVKKAEVAFKGASEKVRQSVKSQGSSPTPTPVTPEPQMDAAPPPEPVRAASGPAKKTVGKGARKQAARSTAARKTIGRKSNETVDDDE